MDRKTIDIITLGCSKNLVDSERLMRQLEAIGYHCTHDTDNPHGQIAIINTCGFIGDAKEESINTILQFIERKNKHQLSKLYVMGCLAERYLADLENELPEVDGFFGKFDFMNLLSQIKKLNEPVQVPSYERKVTTPRHYAYLKIAEGCNRFCSYCAIPLITGRYQSRTIEDIEAEVNWLAKQGVKELQVIAQDLTYYGIDIYHKPKIAELIDRISQIKGIEWIRLHYAYPTNFPLDLLKVMAQRDNVCKYLDIALQHSTDHMLSVMRRHITQQQQTQLIDTIRKEIPGIHIRTTLLVGHPGETAEDFEELKQWTKQMRFERMGCFAYSNEEGTFAAQNYTDDIPQDIKTQRVEELMSIQEQIADEINHSKVGKQMKIIIDRTEGNYYIGRTEFDSPEVDGEVLIDKNDGELIIGEFYNALITNADTFDLYAKII